jgi:hypothetical protein
MDKYKTVISYLKELAVLSFTDEFLQESAEYTSEICETTEEAFERGAEAQYSITALDARKFLRLIGEIE